MSDLVLTKGLSLDLTKASDAPLTKLTLGAGWDPAEEGVTIDMDLSAVALSNGKLLGKDDVCFFNSKSIRNGAIMSMGDNLTGEGEGDDEQIVVDLQALPAEVTEIVFFLNIYDAKAKGQSFDGIKNAFIRAFNSESDQELARAEVSADTTGSDAIIFASVKRSEGAWTFTAIDEFTTGTISELAGRYSA